MPKKTKSEIRKDYFLDKHVIITPLRAKRPHDLESQPVKKNSNDCVLCPQGIEKDLILDYDGRSDSEWNTMVLKNKYPALTIDNPHAYGQQEVIIESPIHTKELHEHSPDELVTVFRTYIKRIAANALNHEINYILLFKNYGSQAGESLQHPHTQLFASHLLPPLIKNELKETKKYETSFGTCPHCDIIRKEAKSERLVWQDDNIIVIAPFASEYHYELWFYSKRHADNLCSLNTGEIRSLAIFLKKALNKLVELNISYNFFTHEVVADKNQHFCLKLLPRDSVWAGVELSTGLIINSVPPEEAAKYYKN
ncbi:DUF4931 domain-containing protein [Candidatus Falkowbacteria bacterium]|nr:DUF4931 domain-containing protein [Candidatus Falkowbacteria bacterium]